MIQYNDGDTFLNCRYIEIHDSDVTDYPVFGEAYYSASVKDNLAPPVVVLTVTASATSELVYGFVGRHDSFDVEKHVSA